MILANSDFGAGAMVVLILFVMSLFVIGGSLATFLRGVVLRRRADPTSRRLGLRLKIAAVLIPLGFFFGPSILFRIVHGSAPASYSMMASLKSDMTMDEVRRVLGEPHSISEGRTGENWFYSVDAIKLDGFWVGFGEDGKVNGIHTPY